MNYVKEKIPRLFISRQHHRTYQAQAAVTLLKFWLKKKVKMLSTHQGVVKLPLSKFNLLIYADGS